jgi:alginate O-acetyltransferase complex protein AlgI
MIILSTFVFFRAETLESSLGYLTAMFSWDNGLAIHTRIAIELDIEFYFTLCLGILISTPIFGYVSDHLSYKRLTGWGGARVATITRYFFKMTLLMVLLALAAMEIANGSYNPFIYFRF